MMTLFGTPVSLGDDPLKGLISESRYRSIALRSM